jgi:hypothetical protein
LGAARQQALGMMCLPIFQSGSMKRFIERSAVEAR